MTRVTNFGRKRTYLEAGFKSEGEVEAHAPDATIIETAVDTAEAAQTPAKKKRKRTPRSQQTERIAREAAEALAAGLDPNQPSTSTTGDGKTKKKKKSAKSPKDKNIASESRRVKRINEKNADTVCFACREKGHAARDCPTTQNSDRKGKAVGICYRCGSNKHSLSRCREHEDPLNPFPFASCFVCSGKGHLASKCPKNEAKGVYPNGGSCKLCGETSHLAKDCGLRIRETVDTNVIMGLDEGLGADEDDFLSFKRRKSAVDRTEDRLQVLKKQVRIGATSGVMEPPVAVIENPSKKTVYF